MKGNKGKMCPYGLKTAFEGFEIEHSYTEIKPNVTHHVLFFGF